MQIVQIVVQMIVTLEINKREGISLNVPLEDEHHPLLLWKYYYYVLNTKYESTKYYISTYFNIIINIFIYVHLISVHSGSQQSTGPA